MLALHGFRPASLMEGPAGGSPTLPLRCEGSAAVWGAPAAVSYCGCLMGARRAFTCDAVPLAQQLGTNTMMLRCGSSFEQKSRLLPPMSSVVVTLRGMG
jgi:hypothetical protein